MKVLIIGGKRFVGYHIADALLKNNHEVIFFNRGRTNSELFPQCENIIGDRNKDLDLLKDKRFDVVIDTCAYYPHQVSEALDVLEGNFNKYLLISTIAVVDPKAPNFDETVDVFTPDYESKEVTGKTYGPLKAACEEVLTKRIGDKAIIIRPGYIVGDMDYTHRFTYYPVLMHFMDEVIMPETGDLRYSYVDGKDLGAFITKAIENNLSGIYQTVGPKDLTFNNFIETVKKVVNPTCKIHYMDKKWFEKNDLKVANSFPTCNNDERGHMIFSVDTTKATNAGFKTRPLEESIKDALDYYLKEKGTLDQLDVGMNPKDMKILLEKNNYNQKL